MIVCKSTFESLNSVTVMVSRRRKQRRQFLGANKKEGTFWWIGHNTVRVCSIGRALDREKAEQGAEKSCRKRRRLRGKRMGGRRSRGCKPPRTGSIRTKKSKGIRAKKRVVREDNWLESRTAIVMKKQLWWDSPERSSASTAVPPIKIYRGLADAVSRITRFDEPMSYWRFTKCYKDEMWVAMGCDITSDISTIEDGDLEDKFIGTNISLRYPAAPPIFEFPSRKKTRRPGQVEIRDLDACQCGTAWRGPTIVRFGELYVGCGLCGHSWQRKPASALVSDEMKARWSSRGGPRRK